MTNINSKSFYSEYYGHRAQDLQKIHDELRAQGKRRFVYLAGDSSLDSKHWFQTNATACNGYEHILWPPTMRQDISYHINQNFANRFIMDAACINAAVEEATICEKIGESGVLNAQDKFIQKNITENDILVVSIGGNDIALKPSFSTVFNMGKMMMLNDLEPLETNFQECWGAPHFIEMFRDSIEMYIRQLVGNVCPKKVIVCMIYYPDLNPGGWAQGTLARLNYYEQPLFLQTVIRQMYQNATLKITLKNGTKVEGFPMFEYLNGTQTTFYCQGVEPSALGNKILADGLHAKLFK